MYVEIRQLQPGFHLRWILSSMQRPLSMSARHCHMRLREVKLNCEAHLEQVLHTILLLVWQVILAAQQKTAGAGQHNIGRLQELDLVNALSAAKQ